VSLVSELITSSSVEVQPNSPSGSSALVSFPIGPEFRSAGFGLTSPSAEEGNDIYISPVHFVRGGGSDLLKLMNVSVVWIEDTETTTRR